VTAADVAVNMQAKNYLPALRFLSDKTLRGEILVPREDCLAGRELKWHLQLEEMQPHP
jgi:hypothetical protein